MASSPYIERSNDTDARTAVAQGAAARANGEAPVPESLAKALAITGVLQTTLELEPVVQLFAKEVNALVAHDGIRYHYAEQELDVLAGSSAPHSCTYRLVVGEQSLGEMTFMREHAFTDDETTMLEYLLCSVVYPLRNALMYRDALRSAYKDPLTGAENRAALETALRREIDLASRHGSSLSLIVIDIDHFKSINDQFGHAVGDTALQAVAACASRTIRSTDVLFRYGGEEFVVLLRNTGLNGALLLAERIRREAEKLQLACGERNFGLTVSAGVSQLQTGDDAAAIFERADKGLYLAKHEGRNRVRIGLQ